MRKTTLFEKAFIKSLNEKLNPKKHDAGDYIKDFEKSKAPQFKGKSKKKKREMAIAAYLDAKEEDSQDLKVRKNKQGFMGSKTRVHKDKKKELSKNKARKKVKEEDDNTVGGALGPVAGAGYGTTVSGTPGTDAYATGDFRRPVALGATYSRFGSVGKKKRKTRKKKNKK